MVMIGDKKGERTMFEWLRKLTATYTEDEYNNWLTESPIDFDDSEVNEDDK